MVYRRYRRNFESKENFSLFLALFRLFTSCMYANECMFGSGYKLIFSILFWVLSCSWLLRYFDVDLEVMSFIQ